MFVLYIY